MQNTITIDRRRARHSVLLAAALIVGGCATVPPEQDPVLIKLTQLEDRLVAIERVVENQSILSVVSQLNELEAEFAKLRGQVETLQFEANAARQRQREQYLNLDSRLAALESRTARPVFEAPQEPGAEDGAMAQTDADPEGEADPATEAAAVSGETDRSAYQRSFEYLKDARYDDAKQGFQQFLESYPDSTLADNAQYWLAEAFYVSREYDTALPNFETVVSRYPGSRKTPDALLKIGFCNYELKQWREARAALERVVDDYQDTTAARLARQRLERMDNEGR
ncbi:MAG: tol-pal system protein YbgF [Pseudomonadota bacterium]